MDVKRNILSDPTILQVRTSNLNNFQLTSSTSDLTAWYGILTTKDGNNVPVLRVQSFLPSSIQEFVNVANSFVALLTRNQFNAAIIDVSGNG